MLSNEILVVIGNYEFSKNADQLKNEFKQYFYTLLIDSNSPHKPEAVDVVIPNTYYPGLWNAAVEIAIEYKFKWLMFIASDVEISSVRLLCERANEAIGIEEIGSYSPSLTAGSRTSFPDCINMPLAAIREVRIIEGFFFMTRVEILRQLYPLPPENIFGWGVDIATCYRTYQHNQYVVIDDRVEIFHPKQLAEHSIDNSQAAQMSSQYLGTSIQNWYQSNISNINGNAKRFTPTSSLDLGCGTKINNIFESNYAFGIDIVESTNPNIKVADLTTQGIPFDDNTFEYITASDFIEHIPRLIYCPERKFSFVELMNEIYRVLKPSGIFLSITPAYPDPKAFQDPTHVNFITEETFSSYFCNDRLWAKMYGFTGSFRLYSQKWSDGKLITLMRTLK